MLAPQLSCSELLMAQLSSHNPQLFLESWVKYLPVSCGGGGAPRNSAGSGATDPFPPCVSSSSLSIWLGLLVA